MRKGSQAEADIMRRRGIQAGEELLGTQDSLTAHATLDEQNSKDFCAALDDTAIQCDQCAQWVKPGEENEDGICGECHDDAEA